MERILIEPDTVEIHGTVLNWHGNASGMVNVILRHLDSQGRNAPVMLHVDPKIRNRRVTVGDTYRFTCVVGTNARSFRMEIVDYARRND